MQITISNNPSDREFAGRSLFDLHEFAVQEPYLAMKMIEFLQSGVVRAFKDYKHQMNSNCLMLQAAVNRGDVLSLEQIGEAFDNNVPQWTVIA